MARLRHALVEQLAPNVRRFVGERQPLVWLLALVTGVAVAYAAILFRLTIAFVQLPWLGTASERVSEAAAAAGWWWVLAAPAAGGLVVGLFLHWVMPGRRAHGVADVIEVCAVKDCRLSGRTGLGSALVAALSLGAGASAGREGPVVHLGAMIASKLEQQWDLPHNAQRTLLASGVAAAVSASFNAPIAGVLFAHEVILGHYALRAFVPNVISSVVGALIARAHFGNFPAFIIPDYQITSYWEFPAFALLGLTAAAVAIAFQFAVMIAVRSASASGLPLWLRPMVGGLMVGAIGVAFPQILGVGYDATDAALNTQLGLWLMLTLLVLKAAATAITLGSGFGGGVFSPSLYLGAMTGGAFGLMAAGVFPEAASSQGLYAILGMGAVAAAVLGAPISTTLIVFELTGGYEMTIALLLAISIASGLTQAVQGVSYFHWQLNVRGLFLHEGPHQHIVHRLTVRDFMTPLAPGETADGFDPKAESWLVPADNLQRALRSFDESGHQRIAVVDPADTAHVLGWADHFHALNAFNKALIEAHMEGHR